MDNQNTQTAAPAATPVVENKGWWTSPSGHYVGGLLENIKGIADSALKAAANAASAGYETAKAAWATTTTAAASGQKTVGEYASAAYSACCQAASRAREALVTAYGVAMVRLAYAAGECKTFIVGCAYEAKHFVIAAMMVGGVVILPLSALVFFPADALAAVVGIGLCVYFGLLATALLSVALSLVVSAIVLLATMAYSAFEGVVDACVAAFGSERDAAPVFA